MMLKRINQFDFYVKVDIWPPQKKPQGKYKMIAIRIPTMRQIDQFKSYSYSIGSARGVMVTVGGNGYGDTSSNPGRG